MSRSRRRCLVASAAICVLSASTAHAQTPAPERTVAAQGVASVKVVAPKDRTHEAPIRAAVEAAEAKALPRAMAAAREKATTLARLSGLTLGRDRLGLRRADLALRALRLLRHLRARSLLRHGPHRGVPDRQGDGQAQARRLPHPPHLPRAVDRHLLADRDLRGHLARMPTPESDRAARRRLVWLLLTRGDVGAEATNCRRSGSETEPNLRQFAPEDDRERPREANSFPR